MSKRSNLRAEIICGDTLTTLKKLPDASANVCVTSPPYWGLRDYQTATWVGGDSNCKHKKPTRQGKTGQRASRTTGHDDFYSIVCARCGARRVDKQLGLEATPEEYISKMVAVFSEVKRVLRDDGTCWINIGDSYAGPACNNRGGMSKIGGGQKDKDGAALFSGRKGTVEGLKAKDLVGIPWMLAFALRESGWYLRQDIIWAKPNPMPESVRDRCTKAHEYLFLLSKQRSYYYNAEAIKEPGAEPNRNRYERIGGKNGHTVRHSEGGMISCSKKRNKRSVWMVTPQPYRGAHFAVFPLALVEPCILAGSPRYGTVLDPFCGSGRAAIASLLNSRSFIGIDLSPKYCRMARRHILEETGFLKSNIVINWED